MQLEGYFSIFPSDLIYCIHKAQLFWLHILTLLILIVIIIMPIAIPLGIIVVRGDCDLETCRIYVDRLEEVSK